ncbi:hypothetical protein COMA2_120043 [Candidatus Nitrospira nitrificans]|uniref:Uncharacterized protein n=1 Tax=Candidatus Nitrospira nitrificans TaxID=1742973 RepID=A0A0S4L5L6_9BACT|nr:hypothetical protein COMA2_120043 [Candidatus Nitrospira nitrificans]
MKPLHTELLSQSVLRSARSKGRARIETLWRHVMLLARVVAPARKGGRGLKLSPSVVRPAGSG